MDSRNALILSACLLLPLIMPLTSSLVTRVTVVRVSLKLVIEDTLVRELAADREGVPHNGPLGLPPQCHHLAHVMDKACDLQPL